MDKLELLKKLAESAASESDKLKSSSPVEKSGCSCDCEACKSCGGREETAEREMVG